MVFQDTVELGELGRLGERNGATIPVLGAKRGGQRGNEKHRTPVRRTVRKERSPCSAGGSRKGNLDWEEMGVSWQSLRRSSWG